MSILNEIKIPRMAVSVSDWEPHFDCNSLVPGGMFITRRWNTEEDLKHNDTTVLGIVKAIEDVQKPEAFEIWDPNKVGFLRKKAIPKKKIDFDIVTDELHTLSDLEKAIEYLVKQQESNDRILKRAPKEPQVVDNSVMLSEGLRLLKDRFREMMSRRDGAGQVYDFQIWAPVESENGIPFNMSAALHDH